MEDWKNIPGFEGIYQVSDQGRVRSLPRRVRAVSKRGNEFERFVDGALLRPGSSRGYQIVDLHPKGTIAVHILVARSFVAGHRPGSEVNHIDGNKTNNAAANLEWVTKKQNQDHAVATGLRKQAQPVTHPLTGERFYSIAAAVRAHGKQARKWGTT